MDLQHSKTRKLVQSQFFGSSSYFSSLKYSLKKGVRHCQLFALYDVGILFTNSFRVIFNAENPRRMVAVNMILTQSSLQRASSRRRRQLLTRQHCKLACDISSCPWLSDCSVPCAEPAPRSSWFSRPSTPVRLMSLRILLDFPPLLHFSASHARLRKDLGVKLWRCLCQVAFLWCQHRQPLLKTTLQTLLWLSENQKRF